jgi:hypothetical protein
VFGLKFKQRDAHLTALAAINKSGNFTLYQVQSQDLPVLIFLPVTLLAAGYFSPVLSLPDRLPPRRMLLLAGAIWLLLGFGSYWIMGEFLLSRDENIVVFDMAVFSKWRLAAPLAPQWREHAFVLVPALLLNSHNPMGLVSDYLPVNALMPLAFSQMVDPAFFNPALAMLGGVALLVTCSPEM